MLKITLQKSVIFYYDNFSGGDDQRFKDWERLLCEVDRLPA